TAFYSFRLIFLVFHGEGRMDEHTRHHLRESPPVVTVPLILLAIPSVIAGMIFVGPMLFEGFFGDSLVVDPRHDTIGAWPASTQGWPGSLARMGQAPFSLPLSLAVAGILLPWLSYIAVPSLPGGGASALWGLYTVRARKSGFDELYQALCAGGGRALGR